ncbi:Ada metal-binding domain-containing protein [Methanocella conradii]|uniref:Ada metal-binding domain-containing protein n=1 Tax=Methanocella conradii TaxID=1175444 RepID=UPI003204BE96
MRTTLAPTATPKPTATPVPTSTPTPTPTAAYFYPTAPPDTAADGWGLYYASSKSDVFHRPGCRYVSQIKSSNLITFSSRHEALDAGYRPCKVCKP